MATLSRFDMELKELNRVIKEKKAMVSQADLNVQEFQHDIQLLNKDKTSAANKVAGLEATYEWIAQDNEWVVATFLPHFRS
jgi:structural maintenance of chromosome 2